MCFYNDDYDWVATVNEVTDKAAEQETRCYECGAVICIGETARFVHQQESEECECDWCQFGQHDPDWEGSKECEHDLGESLDCVICPACIKLLKAIEAHEIAEGCPEYARQPLYGELGDTFWQHEQNWEYAEMAVKMFPELIDHKFIRYLLEDES